MIVESVKFITTSCTEILAYEARTFLSWKLDRAWAIYGICDNTATPIYIGKSHSLGIRIQVHHNLCDQWGKPVNNVARYKHSDMSAMEEYLHENKPASLDWPIFVWNASAIYESHFIQHYKPRFNIKH